MEKLTIIAHIVAKEEKTEFVKAELLKLIDITRAEEGCINYDFHQDNQKPSHFFAYENWENKELLDAHANSQHIKDFKIATEGSILQFDINEMTRIA